MKQGLFNSESFRMQLGPLTKLVCGYYLANFITLTSQLPEDYFSTVTVQKIENKGKSATKNIEL